MKTQKISALLIIGLFPLGMIFAQGTESDYVKYPIIYGYFEQQSIPINSTPIKDKVQLTAKGLIGQNNPPKYGSNGGPQWYAPGTTQYLGRLPDDKSAAKFTFKIGSLEFSKSFEELNPGTQPFKDTDVLVAAVDGTTYKVTVAVGPEDDFVQLNGKDTPVVSYYIFIQQLHDVAGR